MDLGDSIDTNSTDNSTESSNKQGNKQIGNKNQDGSTSQANILLKSVPDLADTISCLGTSTANNW